jgi:hypothetical protein
MMSSPRRGPGIADVRCESADTGPPGAWIRTLELALAAEVSRRLRRRQSVAYTEAVLEGWQSGLMRLS